MTSFTSFRNIGARNAHLLDSVGINSPEDLYDIGLVSADLWVKTTNPDQVSLNMLYALQEAFLDIPWNELPPTLKEELRLQAGEVGAKS